MSRTLSNNDEVMATQPVLYGNEELVTVAQFPDPATANVARAALEAAGIAVFLQGENANSLLPVAFEARVQVRPQDEAEARRVLSDFEAQPADANTLAEGTRSDVQDTPGEVGGAAGLAEGAGRI